MRPLRRLSIRVRLTLGALVIAGVFFAGTAFVMHRQVESILNSSSIMLLESDASPFEQAIAEDKGSALETPGQGQLIAVVDPFGIVRQSTMPAELQPQLLTLATSGDVTQHIVTPKAQYSVISRAVNSSDGTWYVVAARNEAASNLSLDNLTRALTLGLLILTLLFGVGSWLLASAALRPVTAMRRTAIALRESRSTELLPVGPARDELSALATTLNGLIRQLRTSAEREKQLVSDASHELRTPLAILQTQLELAHLSTGDADALLKEIESAERNVQRLSALAASLLELTQIEGMTERQRASVADVVAETEDSIDRARMLTIGSEIVVDYETGRSADAVGSVGLSRYNFGRVVDNLLGNAIVAMGSTRGTGLARAELTVTDDVEGRPARLRLEITDTGPGISADFLPLAFDRFSREDESRESMRAGSRGAGLGLSIVQALVASAGGTISMVNRLPKGLSVVVEVPIDVPTAAASTLSASSAQGASSAKSASSAQSASPLSPAEASS